MYTIGTLKKVKCTLVLEVTFRTRSHLEPPTLWGLLIIQSFIPKIESSVNFGSPKVYLSHSQCLESSNSDHLRTTFLLTTSDFQAHCF